MNNTIQPFSDNSGAEPVRGFLHIPDSPCSPVTALVLTHSAGSNCQAPLLVGVADAFADLGVTVLRCDLPFRQDRPSGPPLRSASRDQAGLRSAVDALRRFLAGVGPGDSIPGSVFLGGHSYGGRMASMLAAEQPELVSGLLLLSYPLHPPRQPQQMRTKHFPQLNTPALFASGTRDAFGTMPEFESALALIPARTQWMPVPAAGHELLSKANRETLPRVIADRFLSWVKDLA